GYAKKNELFKYVPSTKALYNWIDERKLKVINLDLPLKLCRSSKKKRNARKHKKVLGMSIEERPEFIETREEFGQWEIDTVLGHKSNDNALLTLIERKTRHKIIKRVESKSAPAVTKALNEIFADYSDVQTYFKTITSDYVSECSALVDEGKQLRTGIYFAHPYSSWDCGSNESHNGLIRSFIKKGQPIHEYSDEQINKGADWMNTLPRNILGYQAANQ